MAVIDSYSEVNYTGDFKLSGSGSLEISQSFTGNGQPIGSVQLYAYRQDAAVNGTMQALIYAHSGTFGTSSLKTGTALATSDTFTVTSMPVFPSTSALATITFSGANQIVLTNAVNYVLVFRDITLSGSSSGLQMGVDSTSPTHAGNMITDSAPQATVDLIFYVNSGTGFIPRSTPGNIGKYVTVGNGMSRSESMN